MKVNSNQLLVDLRNMCVRHQKDLEALSSLSDQELQSKPGPEAWNAIECIEHLNRYGRFYLPEIKKRLQNSSAKPAETFKSGLLGDYFAESMLPKPGFKTMNTFKVMNPLNADLDHSALHEFSDQLKEILELLEMARYKNLNRIRTSISISKLIKLKLGDTFRVVIYHNERHLQQALRAAKSLSSTPSRAIA